MTEYSDNPEENRKIMKKHQLMLLKGIEESGFYGEFYDLVADFRYRVHSDYKAETIVLSEGYWQIRVKEKKLFGKTTVIDFFATIFWENKEETKYQVLFNYNLGEKDKNYSTLASDYMKGKDIVSHFKETYHYSLFFYE